MIYISTDNHSKSKKDREHYDQQKGTKGQTTIYNTYTQNQRSRNTNPTNNWGELGCSERVNSSCSTSGTHHKQPKIECFAQLTNFRENIVSYLLLTKAKKFEDAKMCNRNLK